jgi:hypothetical protein
MAAGGREAGLLTILHQNRLPYGFDADAGIIPFKHFNLINENHVGSFVLFSKQILSNYLTIATATYEFDRLISMSLGAVMCAVD